jgi:hypothetical protein
LTWINWGWPRARIISGGKPGVDVVKRFLALAAVLFLLLRPMCDVWAAAHDHAGPGAAVHEVRHADSHVPYGRSGEFCCAKVQDGNLIMSGGAVPAITGSDGILFAPVAWSYASQRRWLEQSARHPPGALHRRVSYYARSARILR